MVLLNYLILLIVMIRRELNKLYGIVLFVKDDGCWYIYF